MSTITEEQAERIRQWVTTHHIPSGLGNKEEACSIAAINLALLGTLSDIIPDCMSEVVGRWIIRIQDAMPDDVRNSDEWRLLLPLAAGTGRELEWERLGLILDWMWGTVLPTWQPLADKGGYGKEWLDMTTLRTSYAAQDAHAAADDWAGEAAEYAASAAGYEEDDLYFTYLASDYAAGVATSIAYTESIDDFWQTVDPAALLRRLVEVQS